MKLKDEAIQHDGEATIYPTHTCFDDAVDYINHLCTTNPQDIRKINADYRICHGICLCEDNTPYAHCWLEYRNSVIDGGIYKGEKVAVRSPKHEFYKRTRPQKICRYTIKKSIELEKKIYGYCGPWDEEIRALCKDIKEKANAQKRVDHFYNLQATERLP